ncbi:oxidoreductase [Clostridium sp. Marseille-P2415]|uniref:oxidoreductase n=1 Tax=Clostridium sp. Marseille-P2415 TaxID=1805471 RepID=UPI0009886A70|nr:FAD-dependent oxidoreductase [Clostridium sp. Marseille-P2415]
MKLFEKAKFGSIDLKNRIIMSAMVTNYCNDDGTPSERFTRYHEERAKGGVGMITVEAGYISKAGRGFPTQAGLHQDSNVEAWKKFVERIHACGAKVSIQLHHAGRQTSSASTGEALEAPSPIPCPVMQEMPKELSIERIHELVNEYGAAARRAKEAGFDAVEIHGGHGYLICQFQSAYSNKRQDEYGGSQENRERFPLEVLKSVRENVGHEFPVAYKLSAEEGVAGGIRIEDTCEFAKKLVANGVSAIICSRGVYESAHLQTPTIAAGYGFNVENATKIKHAINNAIPVAVVGLIKDFSLAEKIISEGKADFIVMGRSLICDPEFPNKMKEGRFEDIRLCLSCNQGCVEKLLGGNAVECMINPMAGNEYRYDLSPAKDKKKIVVIGSGPAGLEAAKIAAMRGHDVTLFEKESCLGGQLNEASVPPYKKDLKTYLDYQVHEINKLGVTIRTGEEVTAQQIKDLGVDEVIVATGSLPVMINVPGSDSQSVISARDVLVGAETGENIAVIGGGLVGSETAEFLLTQHKKVTIVEMVDEIARDMAGAAKAFMMSYFNIEPNLNIMCNSKLKEIGEGYIVVEQNGSDIKLENIDTVVMAAGARSNQSLLSELDSLGIGYNAIGDCVKARQIIHAVNEAFNIAITI